MKRTCILVPAELWEDFQKVAAAEDRDRSYVLRRFMAEQVKEHNKLAAA